MGKFFRWLFGLDKAAKSTPESTAPVSSTPTASKGSAPVTPPNSQRELPADYKKAKEYDGQGEKDPGFVAWFSKLWYLVGLPSFKTIIGSTHAWCGYGIAVVTFLTYGIDYTAFNGALAKNYDKQVNKAGVVVSQQIDFKTQGSPQGARVRINHYGDCSRADGNHIAYADGDCTAEDLTKPGATIDLYGANQNDEWNTSTYCAGGNCPGRSKPKQKICTVTWLKGPKAPPLPGKITKSVNCTSASKAEGSTR